MEPLAVRYKKEVLPEVMKKFSIVNVNAAPKLQKICVNVGVGNEGVANKKIFEHVVKDLGAITGQKPVVTKAKKAVSNFKIRQGYDIGVRVTLRGPKMFNFMDKLVNIVLPRVRDFRGINPKSFDRAGNYSMGLEEQIIFPEINIEDVQHSFGMDITFVIDNGSHEKSYSLLEMMGMPFAKAER